MNLSEEHNKMTKKILEIIGEHADKHGVILTNLRLYIDRRTGSITGFSRTFRHKSKTKKGDSIWI